MIVVPFKPQHALALQLQPAQAHVGPLLEPGHLEHLAQISSFTVMDDDKPAACFGWVEYHAARAVLWALLPSDAGRHMVAFTRIAKRLVNSLPHRRIEAEVEADFEQGRRWMELLGLRCETPTPLRAYNVRGGDSYIYAKVK